jgi:putative holliday junction resolvase
MKLLGIDWGQKRVGLALSDALGMLASPLEVFEYKTRPQALERIVAVVQRYRVEAIVVGLPLDMNGDKGPQAQNAEAVAEELRGLVKIPITLWDERLTTAQAQRVLIEGNVSRANRKSRVDMVAAVVLLQAYLDAHGQ